MSNPIRQRIEIIQGNIVDLRYDAIVNAANSSLLGGGGVDGAIHRAAGPDLYEECKHLKGCSTGDAKLTQGYNLPARYVIHTVGPIWNRGRRGEDENLARCYRSSLAVAVRNGVRTIAFPAISTGAYGFPFDRAARIALTEVQRHLEQNALPEKVAFVCFQPVGVETYNQILTELVGPAA